MPTDDRSQRGSVLMLMPAAVLVVVVLGAITVDSAVVFLGQRELVSAAAAAANDAAAGALDDTALYTRGEVVIDPVRAAEVAAAALAARAPRGLEVVGAPLVRVAGRQVCVRVQGRVDRIFATAVPGVAGSTDVSARAAATIADGAVVPADEGLC